MFRGSVLSSSNTRPSQVLTLESDFVSTAEYSPNGTLLATGTIRGDIHLWDIESAKPIAVLSEQGHCSNSAETDIRTISFSADGLLLASTICGRDVILWDMATRTLKHRIETDMATYAIDFSPESGLLVTGSDKSAHIWDITSGAKLCTLATNMRRVVAVGFTRDADRVLAASDDGGVAVWNISGLCEPGKDVQLGPAS